MLAILYGAATGVLVWTNIGKFTVTESHVQSKSLLTKCKMYQD